MQKWVQPIALWFKKELDLDEEKTEVVAYALTSLFVILLDLALLVLVCGLLGVLKEGLVAACTGALLRMFTGGAHLSSPWRCAILSSLLPAFFGLFGKYTGPMLVPEFSLILLLSVLVWGVIIVSKYAPAEVKERPIRPEKKGFYRKAGILLVVLWGIPAVFFLSTNRPELFLAGSCGLWWQTVTLTPPGFTIYRYLSDLGSKERR
ncbi:MAG: accessory gene regulator B family protein [Firmicutes bacterium]|jgi:accessory gene regulator B|nr:accessory gene regulator B family protein [Bacillota bacterium]